MANLGRCSVMILTLALALPAGAAAKKAKAATKGTTTSAKGDAGAPAAPPDKAEKKVSGPPPANSSPMAELKRSNAELDKVLHKNRPNWSPEAELQRAEVRK